MIGNLGRPAAVGRRGGADIICVVDMTFLSFVPYVGDEGTAPRCLRLRRRMRKNSILMIAKAPTMAIGRAMASFVVVDSPPE